LLYSSPKSFVDFFGFVEAHPFGVRFHKPFRIAIHLQQYETDFGVSIAEGDGNTKIGFLKAHQRRDFKKLIFIKRIANASPFLLAKEKGVR